jgi:acyl carrier protein
MNHDPELEILTELARRKLGFSGTLVRESRLVEDLGLDSLRLLTLALAVEDHFRITLSEDDESAISTVGDLIATIERKLTAKT